MAKDDEDLAQSRSRWQLLKKLLERITELPEAERATFLDEECSDDPSVRRELVSLLQHAEVTSRLLEHGSLKALSEQAIAINSQAWKGRRIGAYRVIRLLGHGGMGEVYEATRDDGQYEQRVAIKVVRDAIGIDHAALSARLDAEKKILATLDHPNIARLLDAGVIDEERPYFVMELVEGQPIDIYCQQEGISLRQRVELMRSVCTTVEYAHQQGVIHRDLKPSNILVTAAGIPKLLDFGIAKRIDVEGSGAGRTVTQAQALTPDYASPEQVLGEPIGVATDIYALGLVLYRLLAKQSPYASASSWLKLQEAICETDPAKPSFVLKTRGAPEWRDVQGDLDAVVLLALRKQPQLRYASAQAMADDLFRYLEGLAVAARSGSRSYRLVRTVARQQKVTLGAIAVFNVLLLAGAVVAVYWAREATHQRDRAEQNAAELRGVANTLLFDVNDKIAEIPGTTEARAYIVKSAIRQLEKIRNEAKLDASLRLELAKGYKRIGDALGRPNYPNLGDPAEAIRQYDIGIALLDPDDSLEALRQLAALHLAVSTVDFTQGRSKEALQRLIKASAAAERAARNPASDMTDRMTLAKTRMSHAQTLTLTGTTEGFVEDMQSAMTLYKEVLQSDRGNRSALRSLASVYQNLSWYMTEADGSPAGLAQALGYQAEARKVFNEIIRADPGKASSAEGAMAQGYASDGAALLALGRAKEALQPLEKAIAYWRQQVQLEPANVESLNHLEEPLAVLGSVHLALGEWDLGIARLNEVIQIYEHQPASSRNLVASMSLYASALADLGRVFERRAQSKSSAARVEDLRASLNAFASALKVIQDPRIRPMWQRTGKEESEAAISDALNRVNRLLHEYEPRSKLGSG
ncbi:protein kinase domain-containing protein [Roseateles sp. NT4]|uniref:protein kinase domain-containing protein n=1 Tax=Roseateles sp. NT4 TaxID=3453715 RepID=UPI003EE9B9EB